MKNFLYPLWVIVNVLVTLAAISLWISAPEYKTLNIGLSIFSVTLALLLILTRWAEVRSFIKSHYFRNVLFHVFNVLLVLSIVGVLNYLGNKNYKEFDLTQEKRNSLTEQTLKIISMVKSPLSLTLYAKREEWKPILDVLKLYEAKSQYIQLNAVDTDVRPDLVREKNITENGTIIVASKNIETRFAMTGELSVTNAILKVIKKDKIVLYMITGHQELSCQVKTQEGISDLCQRMKDQNYELRDLDLTQTQKIPTDASAVLIFGPISGFLDSEIKQLENYLGSGGSVYLALAPAFKSEVYDNLTKLARPYGLKLGKDIVIDRLSTVQGSEATIPVINRYESNHPITANFNLRTVFPLSSSVSTLEGNDAATILAFTSAFPGSWAETDLKAAVKGQAVFKENEDLKGPIGLIGIGEKVGQGSVLDSRFILLGSSSFLINAYQNQTGNPHLFLNSLNWLVKDEGLISLNRPGVEEFPVFLSAQHIQLIFVIAILIVPIVFFSAAIFVYRRRRVL